MSKFKIASIQVFAAEDGKQFATAEEAQAYQFMLENEAEFQAIADNHANALKLADRARSLRVNAVKEFLGWLKGWEEAGKPEIERTVFDSEPTPRKKRGEGDADGATAPTELEAEVDADAFGL